MPICPTYNRARSRDSVDISNEPNIICCLEATVCSVVHKSVG